MRTVRLLASLMTSLAVCAAMAQPLPYAQKRRTINAGTLLIESQRISVDDLLTVPVETDTFPANISPHLWYNLDQNAVVKPAAWTFDNPLGQTLLTAEAARRWGNAFPVGFQLGKRHAPYWEILLSNVDDGALARFDVLNLTLNGTLSLNSQEREKIRRYIDQGGILWVDLVNDASLGLDLANGLPYGFDWVVSALPIEANLNHPVLSSPNAMSLDEVSRMSYTGVLGNALTVPVDLTPYAVASISSWVTPDSFRLEAVAGNVDGRSVSVAQLGEGFLVLSARGATATLNRGLIFAAPPPRIPQINRGFIGLDPANDDAFNAAAKFAVNTVSLVSNYATTGAGSRHSGASAVNVEAPMLRRFSADFGGAVFEQNKPSAIFNGYLVTTTDGVVRVFDANPGRDIDSNGDPDDGVTDDGDLDNDLVPDVIQLGLGADLVWSSTAPSNGGTRFSPPTVVAVPNTQITNPLRLDSFGAEIPATNQIWVTDDAGNVYVFDLNNPGIVNVAPLQNVAAQSPVPPPSLELPLNDPLGPFAPTVHEGLIFIADSRQLDSQGRVWVIDLVTGNRVVTGTDWYLRGDALLNPSGAAPTVGYVPVVDNPGALDRVVYVPQQPTTVGPPRPASVSSLWVGARGERPLRLTRIGPTVIRVTTRANQLALPIVYGGPADSLGIKVTLYKPKQPGQQVGDPVPLDDGNLAVVEGLIDNFTGVITDPGTKGEFDIELSPTANVLWDFDGTTTATQDDDVEWRVDYTIDWGQIGVLGGPPTSRPYIRGNLEFPDTAANTNVITGNAALGPNGNLLVATSAPGDNGVGSALFNLKEVKPGEFRLVYRYDLYDDLTFNLNNGLTPADAVNLPASVVDEDGILDDFPFLATSIRYLKFVGAPTVRGDTVYCTAVGEKLTGIKTSAVFAFEADPPPLEFFVNGTDTNFSIVQPDVSRSNNRVLPTVMSNLPTRVFTAEPTNNNQIRVIFNSAMTVTRGRMADTLSSSLPIIVRRANATDTLIEPETFVQTSYGAFPGLARGRFSPLLWYSVINGYRATTSAVVAGDTFFVGGGSLLPSLIVNGALGPFDERGLLFAYEARLSPNNPFLEANSVRSWQQQLWTGRKLSPTPGDFEFAEAVKWPRLKGASDLGQLRVRVLQATINEERVLNLAVGSGVLAAAGQQSLHAFTAGDFVVVDEGRVSRFDPSGNPLWSASQSQSSGERQSVSGSSIGKRFSRPARMYPDPAKSGSFWVVDSGNDRVVLVDPAGDEVRSISELKLDPNFVPQGMNDSEAMTLREPRDVYVYESVKTNPPAPGEQPNPFTNPRPRELWRHVFIADSGHNRIIEALDRYEIDESGRVIGVVSYFDPNKSTVQKALGIVAWHTPEQLSGKRFSYHSISSTLVDDGLGNRTRTFALGFGNVEPGRATFGLDPSPQDLDSSSGYGGVVILDDNNTQVITKFSVPAVSAGAYLEETAPGSGVYDNISSLKAAQPDHKIAGMRSVSVRYINTALYGPRLAVMITEATGIYEIVQADLSDPDSWVVNWMLTNDAYVGMRRPNTAAPYNLSDIADNPMRLQAQYARRLDSGEVLVVNGYLGETRGGSPFTGEVFLLDGIVGMPGLVQGYDPTLINIGFDSLSIVYELPPVVGIRPIVRPVYAERQ